jgi:hypothetical protein
MICEIHYATSPSKKTKEKKTAEENNIGSIVKF